MRQRAWLGVAVACACAACACALGTTSASAAAGATAGWSIRSLAQPTNFAATDNQRCETQNVCDSYSLVVTNSGGASTNGAPIVVTDTLPEHVAVKEIVAHDLARNELEEEFAEPLGLHKPECTTVPLRCVYEEGMAAGDMLQVTIKLTVSDGEPSDVTNRAQVEGGGASRAGTSGPTTTPNTINGAQPGFGVQDFSVQAAGPDGAGEAQAGAHPNSLTTSFDFTSAMREAGDETRSYIPVQDPKTVTLDLPFGLIGDPQAAPQCPEADLNGSTSGGGCPADTRIGTAMLNRMGQDEYSRRSRVVKFGSEEFTVASPEVTDIYNMVPEAGYPATFGFRFIGANVLMYARVVPTPGGYRLRVTVPDIPHIFGQLKVNGAALTFFGDPNERNGATGERGAFLTNPTRCTASMQSLSARMEVDSWVDPARELVSEAPVYPAIEGCDMLQFNPAIQVVPEVTLADAPSGYVIDVKVPQAPDVAPLLATAALENLVVTLPPGTSLSPSSTAGLAGCGEAQIDLLGTEVASDGLDRAAAGHCPSAAQIGRVVIETPLLRDRLEGHAYVAMPQCGGDGQRACSEASAINGELFGLYIEAEGDGVNVKLAGRLEADPLTGQLTARFDENPQLPFSDLELTLQGGARAPLANPRGCGQATTTAELSAWSAPETPDATLSSSFNVSGCSAPAGFAPGFSAGTVTPGGGSFSPLMVSFSRQDREQELGGVAIRLPPGLLADMAGIPRCREPQAQQGTCPAASRIGTADVAAGAGQSPLWLSGSVYLTDSYAGSPFGLSIVVPAVAGPFNLGNVIVRAAIHVDRHTAALSVTSDPLPQQRDGVPLRLKAIDISMDRANFTFNPTNCNQMPISGTLTSAQGTAAGVSSRFAAAGCRNLPFKPKFAVSTQARTSRANGASLRVKLTSGDGQANVAKVKVELPRQLPSRLTTLQKACAATVFDANPASCPSSSLVGKARAITPLLKSPLAGPAYLVSHGDTAFPDLEIVLQGEGITLELDGQTDIRKGITISSFNTLPDAPVSSFELQLPAAPNSVFGASLPARAKRSMCAQKLSMPTAITGHNGALLEQAARVSITGCPKHKARARKRARGADSLHPGARADSLHPGARGRHGRSELEGDPPRPVTSG